MIVHEKSIIGYSSRINMSIAITPHNHGITYLFKLLD